jgi:hypothetical protein
MEEVHAARTAYKLMLLKEETDAPPHMHFVHAVLPGSLE